MDGISVSAQIRYGDEHKLLPELLFSERATEEN